MSSEDCSTCSVLLVLASASVVSSHACGEEHWRLEGALCSSRELLCTSLLWYASLGDIPPWPPQTLGSASSAQWHHWALPGSPLPVLWPGNSFQVVSWDNCRAHFICSPLSGIIVLCCLLSAVWKLFHVFFWVKIYIYIFCPRYSHGQHWKSLIIGFKLSCFGILFQELPGSGEIRPFFFASLFLAQWPQGSTAPPLLHPQSGGRRKG